jgi:thiosulfate dehydrogenase (quinone) large subunit
VTDFLYALPFIEVIIGILILLGGKLGRLGFIAGGLFIAVLLFGTTSHQDWNTASQQVIYLTAFAIALMFYDREIKRQSV